MTKQRFYIKTLGCKVNQYESQLIREGMVRAGYIEAPDIDQADIYVVNSCTVTSASDSKSLYFVRNGLKGNGRCVIVTGCMVEDEDLDLSKFKGAQFIVKNKDKHRIAEIVSHGAKRSSCHNGTGQVAHSESISGLKGHTRVFVKVQDGCSNVCSYCKVRIVRGRSISRPVQDVLDECSKLIANGVREIVLTGICLGAYGRDIKKGIDISRLIEELCGIEGDWRLRLSSIEPGDIGNALVSQLESQKRLCRHLHIPFQSGDDYILKKMKRPYRRRDYIAVVDRLKQVIPDMAISTDIMVGFPGETEERFEETVNFIETVQPMRVHMFPFSKRKGTEAYSYKGNVPARVKKERKKRLSSIAARLSREFIDKFLNKEVQVLIEDKKSAEGILQGYTDRYIKVSIDGPDSLKNRLVSCRLVLSEQLRYPLKRITTPARPVEDLPPAIPNLLGAAF
ncbi:MAG: tRNA (N(6)-L-threonylcarbamoyladenosine(37)-C(2))-methylthiotransferase MtaB [Candidatus Omnitrophica bacterium]|nr:tRNA (N(6)-L-threonylcarbamoyladenosine(37)-C(2))-methylthiotransferase MtaB [Candidatus Omnitrophota bacterium]MBU4149939.1 tRNA (N(6)-L-threonylcarbamoyladenosine(37)-C(2))-methylthiotransferase MtaB [Candidatus Omnitrophota bacterium]